MTGGGVPESCFLCEDSDIRRRIAKMQISSFLAMFCILSLDYCRSFVLGPTHPANFNGVKSETMKKTAWLKYHCQMKRRSVSARSQEIQQTVDIRNNIEEIQLVSSKCVIYFNSHRHEHADMQTLGHRRPLPRRFSILDLETASKAIIREFVA